MIDGNSPYILPPCIVISLVLIWRWLRRGHRLPFPPGPKGLPLFGNVFDIPRNVPVWSTFASMAREYGTDVLYLRMLRTDMIILSSFSAVVDLPEKRSNIYSDRPWVPILELMGVYTWNIGLVGCGTLWKNYRRLLHEFLNVRAVTKFDDYQRKHSYRLLLRLAESPNHFFDHVEFMVAALVMELTYGLHIKNNEDRFLRAAVEATEIATRAMVPGAFLVDMIPILRYVPEWIPGAGFKTFARVARRKFDVAIDEPLEYVRESMKSNKSGSGNPSIAWSSFNRAAGPASKGFDEELIRAGTASIYIAAVETTVSVLHTFFLAMALNPHSLRKAQEELDRVVGGERLPDFSDKENLPYISAVMKETFRWQCPLPLGVPKRLVEDDVYNGHFIPTGAIIFENVWAMFHDESVYPAPETFNPERFLKDGQLDRSVKDPEERVFGTGRRICPGRFFALRTIFLNIVGILALFNIEADEELEAKFDEEHVLRKLVPFKCTVKPRSDASLKLMRFACAEENH